MRKGGLLGVPVNLWMQECFLFQIIVLFLNITSTNLLIVDYSNQYHLSFQSSASHFDCVLNFELLIHFPWFLFVFLKILLADVNALFLAWLSFQVLFCSNYYLMSFSVHICFLFKHNILHAVPQHYLVRCMFAMVHHCCRHHDGKPLYNIEL